MIGQTLAHYEILDKLGSGGMGEVYRARDTKLKRDVAIKVLSQRFAGDRKRMARFEREARVLASLNHPNIAAIYGLEETDGVFALVMELVEGQTLAERIEQGALELEEAIDIATQIAAGLDAAHAKGIIHRDLKPANVMITEDGTVKVLDFGLAKALEDDAPESVDDSNSPTLSRAATQAGVLLGTAGYMSPEQARGKPVDKRADIWALGVVLFEMLTGTRLFHGETMSDTLAAVLKTEPDWTALPAETPWLLKRLLRRCLEKNQKERLHDVADVRLELRDLLTWSDEAPWKVGRTTPGIARFWRCVGRFAGGRRDRGTFHTTRAGATDPVLDGSAFDRFGFRSSRPFTRRAKPCFCESQTDRRAPSLTWNSGRHIDVAHRGRAEAFFFP
jgi:serine/threonine protein kinase